MQETTKGLSLVFSIMAVIQSHPVDFEFSLRRSALRKTWCLHTYHILVYYIQRSNNIYPPVIKRSTGKSPEDGRFHQKITYKPQDFHGFSIAIARPCAECASAADVPSEFGLRLKSQGLVPWMQKKWIILGPKREAKIPWVFKCLTRSEDFLGPFFVGLTGQKVDKKNMRQVTRSQSVLISDSINSCWNHKSIDHLLGATDLR